MCIRDRLRTFHITDWKTGTVEGTELITIDYEGMYCDEALKAIAETVSYTHLALYNKTQAGWMKQYFAFVNFLKQGKDGWLEIRFPQLCLLYTSNPPFHLAACLFRDGFQRFVAVHPLVVYRDQLRTFHRTRLPVSNVCLLYTSRCV